MDKYDIDGEFQDPALRCYTCNKVFLMENIFKHGCCPNCNGKKVKRLFTMNEKEIEWLRGKGVDEDFLQLFTPTDAEEACDA